jgi:hypothetical protein
MVSQQHSRRRLLGMTMLAALAFQQRPPTEGELPVRSTFLRMSIC